MTYDIEYFRSKYCNGCSNKQCDQSDNNVDACISDAMINDADDRFMAGEE